MADSESQNRLAREKSPYLLQHAHNPVNWYPWGEEAFQKAKDEDKPVFLSIGYATCHWCHVMAHESFEDEGIAQLLNHAFINIKVDREERPDIDNTYMTVCQMLTGSGGWPLTIIMTPEKKPFYAATYIPKTGRYGRPGMRELIPRIDGLWNNEREKVYNSAEEIVQAFQKSTRQIEGADLKTDILSEAYSRYAKQYDSRHGGFGSSPKFPSPHNLMYLLRYWKNSGEEQALEMVTHTLESMRMGGIFDQVGFGFHRYATDTEWLVPHFEKMLYDQAMLTMAYTEAWQATGCERFKDTAYQVLQYVLKDLQDSNGAFYSAEDADSEGEEGKFYVWSTGEIRDILPQADAELAIEVFNMDEEGNYQDEGGRRRNGNNILHFRKSLQSLAAERDLSIDELKNKLSRIRDILLEKREGRVRPLLDDKILTDWNGLMIAALSKAGRAFGEQGFIKEAKRAFNFINERLIHENGKLLHRYRDGEAAIEGHADDYAFLIWGLLELYEATFEINYLEKAIALNSDFIENFWDGKQGGFFFTAKGGEELLGRKKEVYDGAIPSGNSAALLNLLKIGRITADTDLEDRADQMMRLFSSQLESAPTGFGQFLQGVHFALSETFEIIVAGRAGDKKTREIIRFIQSNYIPDKVLLLKKPGEKKLTTIAPYTENHSMKDKQTTVYVCKNFSCEQPTSDTGKVMEMLGMNKSD